jgi:hypothetical protein
MGAAILVISCSPFLSSDLPACASALAFALPAGAGYALAASAAIRLRDDLRGCFLGVVHGVFSFVCLIERLMRFQRG